MGAGFGGGAADEPHQRADTRPAGGSGDVLCDGLGLFMAVSTREVLRVLVEGLQWLGTGQAIKVASKAAISQARTRLGAEPLKQLWEQTAQPLVQEGSVGAFYGGAGS